MCLVCVCLRVGYDGRGPGFGISMHDDGLRQEERMYKRPPALPLDVDLHDLLDVLHGHHRRAANGCSL